MATIPYYPNPQSIALTRKNMFNRMLETEKKIKLERMKKNNFPLQLSLPPPRSAGRLLGASIEDSQQTTTADKIVSLFSKANINEHSPPSRASSNVDGDVSSLEKMPRVKAPLTVEPDTISTTELKYDDVSDTSSICHSPGWSDFGDKKKKKKKKQKKAEAKQKGKEQKRKGEPTSNKALMSNRMNKPPVQLILARSALKPVLREVSHSPSGELKDRMLNGSPLTPRSSSLGNGFIGGVKLKSVSDRMDLSSARLDSGDDGDDRKDRTSHRVRLDEHLKSNDLSNRNFSIQKPPQLETSDFEAPRRISSLPSLENYENETSFARRIAKEARLIENIHPGSPSNPALETSKTPKTSRYTSGWPYSSDLGSPKEETSRSDKIRAAVQADLASIRTGSTQRRRHSSRKSSDRTSIQSVDSIENPHSRGSRSRRRSDRSGTERASNTNSQPKKKYSSHLVDEPLTPPYDEQSKPDDSDAISDTQSNFGATLQEDNQDSHSLELDRYHAFLVESATPQFPVLWRTVTADTLSSQDQSKSKASESQKTSFRSTAWATFSRKSPLPNSSDSLFEDAKSLLQVNRPETTRYFSTSSTGSTSTLTTRPVLKKRSGNKADQILGAAISSLRPQMISALENAPSASMSSSSTTDRSDDPDYGSVNDFSNSTTPMSSRPQSFQPSVTNGHQEVLLTSASIAQRRTGLVEVLPDVQIEDVRTSTSGQTDSKVAIRPSDYVKPASTSLTDEGLDFLPELKHQALARPQPRPSGRRSVSADVVPTQASKSFSETMEKKSRHSVLKQSSGSDAQATSSSDSPSDYLRDARLSAPRIRVSRRLGVNPAAASNATSNERAEPIAKMFVICCNCKFFHDLPSRIYEAMATPDNLVEDHTLGVSGQVTTMVRCPWCSHPMSTQCCAGYAAVVHLSERFH